MVTSTTLTDQRVITIAGADRTSFLQGQLTQDMTTLDHARAVLAGGADARGRLQFVACAFTLRDADAIALMLPVELAADVVTRLKTYVFRAKVQINILDCGITGAVEGEGDGRAPSSLRLPGPGKRSITIGPATGTPSPTGSPETANEWELAELRAGIPAIVKATVGRFVPQMVNLDLLGGISFTKGCYTGQEIVARTKYLGRVKRRMLRFSAAGSPPPAGALLHAARKTGGTGTVGEIVRSAATPSGCEFLAVVMLDDLPEMVFLDEALAVPARRLDLPYDIPL